MKVGESPTGYEKHHKKADILLNTSFFLFFGTTPVQHFRNP